VGVSYGGGGVCVTGVCVQVLVKLFALSWYMFLTYIYDARSHLHQTY